MRHNNLPFKFHRFNFKFVYHTFGEQTTTLLKQWIDTNYRIIKASSKLNFLRQCKFAGVLPNHIFKVCTTDFILHHFKSKKKLESVLVRFRKGILNIEIGDLYRLINFLQRKLLDTSYTLSISFPNYIWREIVKHHSISFKNFREKLYYTHFNKFQWLLQKKEEEYMNNIKPIKLFTNNRQLTSLSNTDTNNFIFPNQFQVNPSNPLDCTNNKWFINLTDMVIPKSVSNLIQLGSKFSLPINNKKLAIHEFIKDIEGNSKRSNIKNLITVRNNIAPQFSRFLHNVEKADVTQKKLLNLHKCTLRFCHDNPNILFTRADKGNVTVAMTKEFYTNKVENLLKDTDTYSTIKKNPSLKIERELNNTLKNWLKKEYISKKNYYFLRSSDSLLPKAYGLPKIHKENVPFRIIVSSVNTALYNIANYLHNIFSSSIPQAKSNVNNSFELYSTLSGKTIEASNILISLDVVSLFTNIPTNLAIDSINNRWNYIEAHTIIPKNEFISIIKFILSSTYFTFNDNIYKQTYGTPMGSPLSPIIANMVMQDLEESILDTLNVNIPFYYRYVDDIFLVAPMNEVTNILNKFNDYHERLKFTVEYEDEGSISFLDLNIKIINNSIYIDWFHKKTFSGRLLSFLSNHPICHKIGTIYNLVDRALRLSHPIFHKKNIETCINILLNNGYPLNLIFKEINHRIKTIHNKKPTQIINSKLEGNNTNYFVIPYINNISNFVAPYLKKSDLLVGYRCLNKLGNIIRVQKDKNIHGLRSNVIYRINCNNCDASYVGQTKRQLGTRLKEHKKNIMLESSKHSVVSEHIVNTQHNFNWDNVKILDIEMNYRKRLISEMLHIKEQKHAINSNTDTELLDNAYDDILKELSNR